MSAATRFLAAIGGSVLLAAAAWGAVSFWDGQRRFVSTKNAYVKGEITTIAARVPGYAVEIFVDDNQRVAAKQPLFRIDPRDYRAALQEADAQIAIQQAALSNLAARRVLQDARIAAARSTLEARQAEATFAQNEFDRASRLVDSGTGTRQRLDDTAAADIVARARVTEAQADLGLEAAQTDVLDAEQLSIEAALSAAQATRDTARITLEDTQVWAPAAGVISNRRTRVGEYLAAGVATMALVPDGAIWVEANIRETELARLVPGDRAEVAIDVLGGAVACATVESIAPAAGSEFALIPADNATGNFTKIVRRFAVRLRFDATDALLPQIAPGMSVVPRIAIGSHRTGAADAGGLPWTAGTGFACGADGPVRAPAPAARQLPDHPGLRSE
ncbi:HlyD family secretion protein [Sulfitobacter sp. S190]|uniref:HlyD family secretion protein n=1 Tax=Sulfitobacter sp. S190 TaxID=2867022 RepID=UPI0021A354D5|nr:HlyD family secretion protein [Sulfitobacter sp. S190]UWR24519.1 HlyD family secretion protein [Sulfitobacter sp. S190]